MMDNHLIGFIVGITGIPAALAGYMALYFSLVARARKQFNADDTKLFSLRFRSNWSYLGHFDWDKDKYLVIALIVGIAMIVAGWVIYHL